jgi:SagB-type dehydrogenase family enzyme
MSGKRLDRQAQPRLYKEYPDSPRIALPPVASPGGPPLYDILQKRRSVRDFKAVPITSESLSYLLWASTGISARQQGYDFRTAPSAGALYPIETYLAVKNVTGIEAAIYHYCIQRHVLELLSKGEHSAQVARAALDQQMCMDAPVVFMWTAVFQRSKWKYGQRAYRYIYLDAGHIAANLALAAAGMNLGSCQIGALYDDEVNELIGVDGIEESVVYMSAVGRKAV